MAANLTPEQVELKNCIAEFDALEKEVNSRSNLRGTETKEIPFEFAESFVFVKGDMKPQRRSFKNGAEDLYFSEPCFTVIGVAGTVKIPLSTSEVGLGPSGLPNTGAFDFFWNYAVGSQGENYANSANDLGTGLSRKSLSNRSRWLPLAFRYPLRLKGGDSLTVSLKPAFWAIPLSSLGTLTEVVINMTMTGRRNGRMAESQFDPEFRPAYRADSVKDIPKIPNWRNK